MSTSFSANQYDDAFSARKLRNWQTPKLSQERPRALNGSSKITADDRGHLQPEFRRSKTEPWGSFVGTWDMPKKIPGNHIDVPTARNPEAYDKLRQNWEDTRFQLTGRPWGTTNNTLYREGTRSLILRTSNGPVRSRSNGQLSGANTPSQLPRKLTPLNRDGASPDGVNGRPDSCDFAGHGNGCGHSAGRIPLPKLDRPVYAEETCDGQVMMEAM